MRSGFFLLMLLVLIGITFCKKPDLLPILEELPTSVSQVSSQTDPPENTNRPENIDLPEYLNPDLTYGLISDIESNIYRTIQIGTQTWMAENLKTTRYNDGSQISNVRWYNNDITYKNKYGALYDQYTVNTGNLCPTGWHVPTDEEWKKLEMALGMTQAAANSSYLDFDVYGMGFRGTDQGTQMKATSGWSAWEGRIVIGTNTSGFSALPAGDTDGGSVGVCTTWWCYGDPWARTLGTEESGVSRALYYRHYGFSIRCLKD